MDAALRESMASSERNDWGTPEEVLSCVYKMGEIELDPCANLRSIVKCNQRIVLPEDGLAVSWRDRVPDDGLIFVNSPYGRQVKKWTKKCVLEGAANGCEIIALVAARVDTNWFQDDIFSTADLICFWKGRIRFIDLSTGLQGDPAFFPSAIAYWGSDTEGFYEGFMDKGQIVNLRG